LNTWYPLWSAGEDHVLYLLGRGCVADAPRYDLKLWIGFLRESATYPPA
jgi:hypothetical protein